MFFTYAGSANSEVGEELCRDSATKLSIGIGKVFNAMVSCPSCQVASGRTVIDVLVIVFGSRGLVDAHLDKGSPRRAAG